MNLSFLLGWQFKSTYSAGFKIKLFTNEFNDTLINSKLSFLPWVAKGLHSHWNDIDANIYKISLLSK